MFANLNTGRQWRHLLTAIKSSMILQLCRFRTSVRAVSLHDVNPQVCEKVPSSFLRYTAKFDPFLSINCAHCPPPWRNPRKGRNQILPSGTTVSYLYHLGVPEGAGEDGSQSLGGLVDGDASEERLVVDVAVGEAGEAVGVQHLHRPVEQAVLRRSPALP